MTRRIDTLNEDELIRLYLSGISVNALAQQSGVSRTVIHRILSTRSPEPMRTILEANLLSSTRRTPAENRRNSAAAQAARRGQVDGASVLERRAATRERLMLGVSGSEMMLLTMLQERGLDAIPQKAIGPYNVDLAAEPVAVEVFGGGWHTASRHAARYAQRRDHLLDAGWNLLVVWVDWRHPLTADGADEVVAFVEQSRRDPAFRSQERMIWGDADPSAPPSPKLD